MGICRFCRKPAGFLRKEHKECKEKVQSKGYDLFSTLAKLFYLFYFFFNILKISHNLYFNFLKLYKNL
jgi:hypothetical protein